MTSSTPLDTRLTLAECRRCAAFLLHGHVAGIFVRADTVTVPPDDAAVLVRYGYLVLVAEISATGIWADFYTPATTDPNQAGRYLLTAHSCSRTRPPRGRGEARHE
jgi:hypothetical protein